MRQLLSFLVAGVLIVVRPAGSEPVETEIPEVTAELIELRQAGGVLRLAMAYRNRGPTAVESARFPLARVVLVDVKSRHKYFPLKDAAGEHIGGPLGDTLDGGRALITLPPGGTAWLWSVFEPLAAGTVVSVEVPQMFPFEDVVVTQGKGELLQAASSHSSPAGVVATLVSAKRADQALKVRLKLAAATGGSVRLRSPYFEYRRVYLFDPKSKRRYPLLKDAENLFQAQPLTVKSDGGSFLPDWSKPILMSLTFPAPPDSVQNVDLVLPDFLPFEGLSIEGSGGAAEGGLAAEGKVLGLEAALRELKAEVSPEEIRVDLSADVLFDVNSAELKVAAEDKMRQLLTVIRSRPPCHISIEGHTDVRGTTALNQALSERRAASVRRWLVDVGGIDAPRVTAAGAGESRPVRTGSSELDHQANRRVEIRIQACPK